MKIPLRDISSIGASEKYIRKNHYNTVKCWWARRPLMASRAILINELLTRSGNKRSFPQNLVYELNPPSSDFESFAKKFNTKEIKLLDVFSGGGSIPFESARLGLDTHSSELNPIASLLQETIFDSLRIKDYPQKLKQYADIIINNAEKRLTDVFNVDGINPYVVFWGKVAKCKKCKSDLDLSRIKYLSKKPNKTIVFSRDSRSIKNVTGASHQTARTNGFICEKCKTNNSFADIKTFCKTNKLASKPLVICYHLDGKKSYTTVSNDGIAQIEAINKKINTRIATLAHLIPDEEVCAKHGVINPTLYDLKKPADFFNNRQLLVLLTVIDEICNIWKKLQKEEEDKVAIQIVKGLTSLIEFLVDWNSQSTMWIPQNEQTGRSLAGPGVAMKWDYIEVNPFYSKGSNLRSKITRVSDTLSKLSVLGNISIHKGSSSNLSIPSGSIDIVLTDPPYYDSVDYTALSEFFRPWFEVIINNTYDPLGSLKNDISQEAIVELARTKTANKRNSDHYKKIMTEVLCETHRVLAENGSCLMMYSHKTIEGWQVIAEAIKSSGFFIDCCFAYDMERKARPRAMQYDALSGVIVFRMTKDDSKIEPVSKDIRRIKSLAKDGELSTSNIAIYIASLACKEYCLSSAQFHDCYSKTRALFEKTQSSNNSADSLVSAYISAFRSNSISSLGKDDIDLLLTNGLLDDNKIISMTEVDGARISSKETMFSSLLKLFQDNIKNSGTTIDLDEDLRKNALLLYDTIGGIDLNTVRDRSSGQEQKIARLIVSKIR